MIAGQQDPRYPCVADLVAASVAGQFMLQRVRVAGARHRPRRRGRPARPLLGGFTVHLPFVVRRLRPACAGGDGLRRASCLLKYLQLPEIAEDAALMVNPTDTQALAECIGVVLSDDSLREQAKGLARS